MIATTFSCSNLPIFGSILLIPESAPLGVILSGLKPQ
jgi:hypothetical protein